MRKSLCLLDSDGQKVHVWQRRARKRRVGYPWSDNGRVITVGWVYFCSACGDPGFGVPV